MPPSPPRLPLLRPRALLIAALACVGVATAMQMPDVVKCALGSEDQLCRLRALPNLRAWLAIAVMLYTLWLAAALTQPLLPRAPHARRWALALQIGVLTLFSVAVCQRLHPGGGGLFDVSAYTLQVQLFFAGCICVALDFHARGRRGQADADTLRRDAQARARQLDAARAALLQAQVEPHFLFNTLAHLRRLAQIDIPAARAMLAELRLYLDAALPELRQPATPLSRELALVSAFLALHQRRIGAERLTLRYDIAPGLDDIVVPSTCLLTLAENAIKHGIAPQVAGGEIVVRAGPDPDEPALLRLEVADTGAGMGSASGGGTGLATLRARLASAHGAAARLSLHLNEPRGLVARIHLPRAAEPVCS